MQARDAGLSLAELIVSMMIVSLVLIVGATLTVTTLQHRNFTAAKTSSQADTRLALRQLSRDLRTAAPNGFDTSTCVDASGSAAVCKTAFAFASRSKIIMFTSKGGASPVLYKVTYEVQASTKCLLRTEIKASAGGLFNTANAKTRCVGAGQVQNPSLFTFNTVRPNFATAGTPLTVPAAGITLSRATDATLASIADVTVNLTMSAEDQPGVGDTSVTQTITLLNQTTNLRN